MRLASQGWKLQSVVAAALVIGGNWPGDAHSATECVNQGAPAPIEFCVKDDGTPAVWVEQPNGRVAQYYADYAWSSVIWLDKNNPATSYTMEYTLQFGGSQIAVTPVSNTLSGAGTSASPYAITTVFDLGASGVRVTQTFSYVNGDRTLRKRWSLANTGVTTYTNSRFFHGGDTTFGGSDSARSWYDPGNTMVYVTNPDFTNSGLMGFYANPATPAAAYMGGNYYEAQGIAAGIDVFVYPPVPIDPQLPDTADSSFLDAGYQLQWNRASLAPGQTWNIESFETWSAPGALQVLSPADDFVIPGSTVRASFKVHNLSGGALPVTLAAASVPTGWTVSLPNGNSINLNSLQAEEVAVDITVPANATPGTSRDIALTATSGAETGTGTTRLAILQADYAILPTSVSFQAGGAVDQTVTLSNGASGSPVDIGQIASVNTLAAPFSITADSCSNTTVAAGASCSITVHFTPANGSLVSDTFNWPILAPVITSQTITVTGNVTPTTHAVQGSAGSGGAISPPSAAVAHGATTSFTVTPDVGYSISSVTGCGGSLAGNSFTTGAINAACTVTASFSINSYSVTASAGMGGSISPAAATVSHGATTIFTVSPSTGYAITGVSGCGGTLNGSTFTTGAVTGACAISASFAAPPSTAPTFSPASPAVHEIDATALRTELPQSIAPRAFDADGAELSVTLDGGQKYYPPGEYTLTWRAIDGDGIASTVQQILRIWPTVSLGPDVSLGFLQGNSTSFRIALNGAAPQVPFTVGYTVSGHLTGHDLESGSVQFGAGETEKEVFFAVTQTPASGTPPQDVQVDLDEGVNRGKHRRLTVHLLTQNAAPVVVLAARQAEEIVPVLSRSGESVTILADIRDPDSEDTHTVEWVSPAGAVVTAIGTKLTLQADSLPAGLHRFEALVTDNGAPALSTRGVLDIVLAEAPTPLPDGAQAWTESGLPDHVDYSPPVRNVLPEREQDLTRFLIEGDPGLRLSLGPHALQEQRFQAELRDASIGPDTVTNVGGYFDFTVSDLAAVGQSVNVVVPQRVAIPANPVYRKYDLVAGQWKTFVEDAANALASAPGAEGLCPPPGSEAFRPGLNPGDWCVRLTLSDGGPNDGDGQGNGVVVDPGGVGSLATVVVTTSGKGGGGLFDPLLLLFGSALLLFRRVTRPRGAAILLVGACAAAATASAQSPWYGGLQLGPARGDIRESDVNARLQAAGYDVVATFADLDRSAWRAYAGYQLSPHLGVEAGYTDLGEVRTRLEGDVLDIEEFLRSANQLQPHSAHGFELSLHARYPLTKRIFIAGNAGALRWNSRYRASNQDGESDRLKDEGTSAFLGLGVELALNRGFSLDAGWTRYRIDGETIGFTRFGVSYRFE